MHGGNDHDIITITSNTNNAVTSNVPISVHFSTTTEAWAYASVLLRLAISIPYSDFDNLSFNHLAKLAARIIKLAFPSSQQKMELLRSCSPHSDVWLNHFFSRKALGNPAGFNQAVALQKLYDKDITFANVPNFFIAKNPYPEHLTLIANIKDISLPDIFSQQFSALQRELIQNSLPLSDKEMWKNLLQRLDQPGLLLDRKIVEKWRKNAKKLNEKLSSTSDVFKPLTNLMSDLRKSLAKKSEISSNNYFVGIIHNICALYSDYIKSVCGASQQERLVLTTPLAHLRGVGIGNRYLTYDVACALLNFDLDQKPLRRKHPGNHIVTNVGNNFYKNNPQYTLAELIETDRLNLIPAVEHAVSSLYSVLAGEGVAPTSLIKVELDKKVYFVQASKGILGDRFDEFLEGHSLNHAVIAETGSMGQKENFELLYQFPILNYSALFVASLIARPADGKSDNYVIVSHFKNEQLHSFTLYAIDIDLAFCTTIFKKSNQLHQVLLRDILYCLPQQHNVIDAAYRTYFLQRGPENFLFDWLRQLQQQQYYYQRLLEQNIFTANEFFMLRIPLRFCRGEIQRVYERLKKIQSLLQKYPGLTHTELFENLEPIVGRYYAVHSRGINNPLEKYKAVHHAPDIEKSLALNQNEKLALSKIECSAADFEDKREELLIPSIERFVRELDFSTITDTEQANILNYLLDFSEIQRLEFKNCSALIDDHLKRYLKLYPHLQSLTLINCPMITEHGLSALLQRGSPITLTLGQRLAISYASVKVIFRYCQENGHTLRLHCRNGLDLTINLEDPNLLHDALLEPDSEMIRFLLEQGVHTNTTDEYLHTPLHIAAKQDEVPIIIDLLVQAGADINAKDERGQTPLEKALKWEKPLVLLRLLSHGATCPLGISPVISLCTKALLVQPNNKDLQIAFFDFLIREKSLRENLVSLFSFDKTITQINLTDQPLSDLGLEQLLKQNPHLESLDITGCNQLTVKCVTHLKQQSLSSLALNYAQAVTLGLIKKNQLTVAPFVSDKINISITALLLTNQMSFSDNAILDLILSLQQNNTLKQLEFFGYPCNELIAKAITATLANSKTITHLAIKHAKLTDALLERITAGLQFNQGIIALDISGNSIDIESFKALLHVVQKHPSLKTIQMTENNYLEKLSLEEWQKLQQISPSIKLIRSFKTEVGIMPDQPGLSTASVTSRAIWQQQIPTLFRPVSYETHISQTSSQLSGILNTYK